MSERLNREPEPEVQPLSQEEEFGVVINPDPTAEIMRFTDPTRSEKAQGADDPSQIISIHTATGFAVVTRSELNRDNKDN